MKTVFLAMAILFFIPVELVSEEGKEAEYVRQGARYFEAREYQSAVRSFGRALRINPGSAEAHKGMGISYLSLGSSGGATNVELVEKAVSELREAIRLAPESAEARYHVGVACLLLEDKEGAVAEHKALLGLNPEFARQLQSRIAVYQPRRPFSSVEAGDSAGTTRVTVVSNSVLVATNLSNGDRTVAATLVLDTGASIIMITSDVANRLGLDPGRAKQGRMMVADGRYVPAWHTKLDLVAVGPKSKRNVDVVIVPDRGGKFPVDGLLGMNFLKSFSYSIDFKNQLIRWSR